ncbi:hypothetical protein FDECE_10485 [Fusarium decemcellulare]|nr:hypothetical protein FDECE_10485 [Fusarium decemcellulare]
MGREILQKHYLSHGQDEITTASPEFPDVNNGGVLSTQPSLERGDTLAPSSAPSQNALDVEIPQENFIAFSPLTNGIGADQHLVLASETTTPHRPAPSGPNFQSLPSGNKAAPTAAGGSDATNSGDGHDNLTFMVLDDENIGAMSNENGQRSISDDFIQQFAVPSSVQANLGQPTRELDHFTQQLNGEWSYWWICQCTPLPEQPPSAPSEQAISMLAKLDTIFSDPGPWSLSNAQWRSHCFESSELFVILPIEESTRESILVIVQGFLRRALESHGLNVGSSFSLPSDSRNGISWSGCLRLPPTNALYMYLEMFLGRFEPHYPLLPSRSLDPNNLAGRENNKGLILLLLSMLAYGSMLDPAPKAQGFSRAITEICRLSMTDISSKDSSAMVKSAGLLQKVNITQTNTDLEKCWKGWVEQEASTRLACSWILIDQAISLFYDLPPILKVSELQCRLPSSERLWLPPNPEAWVAAWQEEFGPSFPWWDAMSHQSSSPTLQDLFKFLIFGKLDEKVERPEPLHMMLLLFPIQTLVTHFSQQASCSSDASSTTSVHFHSRELFFDDFQQLLYWWSKTFQRIEKRGFRGKAMADSALAMYHVINLNLYTSFDRLESLARRETTIRSFDENPVRVWYLIRDPEKALEQCGQMFALFRRMGDAQQPIWSAAAIYRATIVLWAIRLFDLQGWLQPNTEGCSARNLTEDDNLPTSPLWDSFLHCFPHQKNGQVLSTGHDRQSVGFADPQMCIQLGVEAMRHSCPATPFTLGVILKLESMLAIWEQAD